MANVSLNVKLIHRNDTLANWESSNPVLLKGEMGIATDKQIFKVGDGASHWNDLKASTAPAPLEGTTAPTTSTEGLLGGLYTDTTHDKTYVLVDITDGTYTWKQIVTPDDLSGLGYGDMLKATYATNDKSSSGYVDKAILADGATEADAAKKLSAAVDIALSGDATGSASFDGSEGITIAATLADSGVSAGTYTKVTVDGKGRVTSGAQMYFDDITVSADDTTTLASKVSTIESDISGLKDDKQDKITGAATSIVSDDLTASMVLASDANGKVTVSTVSKSDFEALPNTVATLRADVDNIPKYNYLTGVEIESTDDNISNQTAIDEVAIAAIATAHADPAKWDAVVVGVTFRDSDVKKDALYFYNGTAWTFLYYVSTGINRANGTTAGIVENSADITFADGQGTVVQAGKVKHGLTIGSKTFDGSADVTIGSADLADSIPVATADKVGGVKSSTNVNEVAVGTDGVMSLNTVAVAKLALNGDTLILDGGTAATV